MSASDNPEIKAAQSRMSRFAVQLAERLGAMDAAGLLMGAAVGVLTSEYGADTASHYLEELAEEMANSLAADGEQQGRDFDA
jgi:hypothetical protein